VKENQF